MSRLVQIHLTFITFCVGITLGVPVFQGLKIQKGFEIDFKPFAFKPLSFFKEIWTPFGRYGVRKGIQKRDLSTTVLLDSPPPPLPPVESVPVAPAPVHEIPQEVIQQPIYNLQAPLRPLAPGPDVNTANNGQPLEAFKPIDGLYTNVGRVPPVESNLVESPIAEIHGELPPRPIGAVAPPLQSPVESFSPKPVLPLPPQPVKPLPQQPEGPLPPQPITPIQPIQVPPMNVVPLIMPPAPIPSPTPAEIPPSEGPLVRGSRIALYLGGALVRMVSQFLATAKLQISRLTSPGAVSNPAFPQTAVQVMPLLN